jgi:hypothetical protein
MVPSPPGSGAAAALPAGVKAVYARADAGFYCFPAVQADERRNGRFIMVVRRSVRLMNELRAAHGKPSLRTDAEEQCAFRCQPAGWGNPYRILALRYRTESSRRGVAQSEQYSSFDMPEYTCRIFITDMDGPLGTLGKGHLRPSHAPRACPRGWS